MLTRKRLLLGAGAIVVVVAIALAAIWFTDRDTEGTSAAPTTTQRAQKSVPAPSGIAPSDQPTPSPVASMDPAQAAKDAQAAVRSYVALTDKSYAQTGESRQVVAGLTEVATGQALGKVQANLAEQTVAAYHQEGSSSVASASVTTSELAKTPPSITMTVCRDQSKVGFVFDSTGGEAGSPSLAKVKEIYSLSYLNGTWMVADVTMPDNPTC